MGYHGNMIYIYIHGHEGTQKMLVFVRENPSMILNG